MNIDNIHLKYKKFKESFLSDIILLGSILYKNNNFLSKPVAYNGSKYWVGKI